MLAEPRKVLVVDDEEDARAFVRSILEAERWDVLEAKNGVEALHIAEEEQPDLVVLDVMMPEMNGFEAYRRLRGGVLTSRIPIIMLTSVNEFHKDTQHSEETMATASGLPGPEGFVDKPVDPDFLLYSINGIMG